MAKSRAIAPRGRPKISRQEQFCRLLVMQGMLASAAYAKAYAWKGDERKAERMANAVLELPAVQQRIRELRADRLHMPNGGRDMLTLEEHMAELAQMQLDAACAGQYGPAVTACIARGKVSGLYVERSVTAKVTLEELIAASRRPVAVIQPPPSKREIERQTRPKALPRRVTRLLNMGDDGP